MNQSLTLVAELILCAVTAKVLVKKIRPLIPQDWLYLPFQIYPNITTCSVSASVHARPISWRTQTWKSVAFTWRHYQSASEMRFILHWGVVNYNPNNNVLLFYLFQIGILLSLCLSVGLIVLTSLVFPFLWHFFRQSLHVSFRLSFYFTNTQHIENNLQTMVWRLNDTRTKHECGIINAMTFLDILYHICYKII